MSLNGRNRAMMLNGPNRDALRSLFDGARSGEREQTVLTPPLILEPLRSVWGRIALDPCAPPGSSYVAAEHEIRLPDDGLRYQWIDRTFVNPEYKALRDGWLEPHTVDQARIAWLVPVRPHRRWWRAWARTCEAVIYLDPFPFVGHDQVFPGPLCIGYRGADAQSIVDAFRELGEAL